MMTQPNLLVLVVDDEVLIRLVATEMLADNGFMTLEAADGPEALELLNARPDIAVLLTDINMPGSPDGLGLAREARLLRPNIHIVVASGRVTPGESDMPPGSRFIAKPYDCSQLLVAVEHNVK